MLRKGYRAGVSMCPLAVRRQDAAAGQAQPQPQSFQQQPQGAAEQKPAAGGDLAPLTIHPDITLDQNTKILTVGQGQASIFGQKYTLPALPFKLPATPALNSLQSLYPSEPPACCQCAGRHLFRRNWRLSTRVYWQGIREWFRTSSSTLTYPLVWISERSMHRWHTRRLCCIHVTWAAVALGMHRRVHILVR